MDDQRLVSRLRPLVFALGLVPLGLLVHQALLGEGLGANPVETITRHTGIWTLRLLLVTLALTPLRRATGLHALVRLRRMVGLFAFFYLTLHVATYVWLDAYFDPAYVLDDVVKRPYVTAGFTGLVLLVPLAATSTDAMVRRLGGRTWRRLHRLVYLAAGAGAVHFLWLVKADLRRPLLYASVLAALLALRLPPVARALSRAGAWLRSLRPRAGPAPRREPVAGCDAR